MCLVLFALGMHPRYPLIVASNRDEYHNRPAAPIHRWKDYPNIIAGRDLEQSGTWMGVTESGRWAIVTNFREQKTTSNRKESRGNLTKNFLTSDQSPQAFASSIGEITESYNGFNLLVGDSSSIYYVTNRQAEGMPQTQSIEKPGVYGLSNHLLDTNWPKVTSGKKSFATLIKNNEVIHFEEVVTLMSNTTQPHDEALPDTGVDPEWERTLSPMFITSNDYGTRATSLLLISSDALKIELSEMTFDVKGKELTNHTIIV